jgi:hypothetical protein
MKKWALWTALGAAVAFTTIGAAAAHEDGEPVAQLAHELDSALEHEHGEGFDTKHVFGFTEGTDNGHAGEREMELETTIRAAKLGGGRYGAVEQEAVYESIVTDRFGYEASLHGLWMTSHGVPGLENRSGSAFSGFSVAPKFILLKRGVDSPIGLAVSIAPEWDRIDPIGGGHASNYVVPIRLMADVELIHDKLYGAANLLYAPEWDSFSGLGNAQNALLSLSGALAYRAAPKISIGGQIEYINAYTSTGLRDWAGWGFYIGPAMSWKVSHNIFVKATWAAQIAGKQATTGGLAAYDAADLSRQRANLLLGVEF